MVVVFLQNSCNYIYTPPGILHFIEADMLEINGYIYQSWARDKFFNIATSDNAETYKGVCVTLRY